MGGAVTLFVIERAWAEDAAASALTEAVLAFAKENGFEQLNLEVRSDNARAIRLYEKYGFRKLCTFPDFFKIDGESIDFDLMNLELTPGRRPTRASCGTLTGGRWSPLHTQ